MADQKISQLTDGSPALSSDLVPVARGSGNAKLPAAAIRGLNGVARRNFIRNGDFMIAQRGTSIAGISTAQYSLDGVRLGTGGATDTVSQQAFAVGQTDVPGNPSNFLRIQRTGAAAGANSIVFFPIESPARFSGQQVTFHFYGRVSSGTKTLRQDIVAPSTTPAIDTTGQLIQLTTSWQRFVLTETLPAMTAAPANSWISPRLVEESGVGTWTLDIADVQFELGDVATPFERLPYEEQLRWAWRYLPGISASASAQTFGLGAALSANDVYVPIRFPVRVRIAPTGIAVSNATHFAVSVGGSTASTSVSFSNAGPDGGLIVIGTAGGLTQFRPYLANFANAAAYILFTGAELS